MSLLSRRRALLSMGSNQDFSLMDASMWIDAKATDARYTGVRTATIANLENGDLKISTAINTGGNLAAGAIYSTPIDFSQYNTLSGTLVQTHSNWGSPDNYGETLGGFKGLFLFNTTLNADGSLQEYISLETWTHNRGSLDIYVDVSNITGTYYLGTYARGTGNGGSDVYEQFSALTLSQDEWRFSGRLDLMNGTHWVSADARNDRYTGLKETRCINLANNDLCVRTVINGGGYFAAATIFETPIDFSRFNSLKGHLIEAYTNWGASRAGGGWLGLYLFNTTLDANGRLVEYAKLVSWNMNNGELDIDANVSGINGTYYIGSYARGSGNYGSDVHFTCSSLYLEST